MDAPREDIMDHSAGQQAAPGQQEEWLKDRLEWFQDLKLGLFLHWGIYSQWDCCESWPLVEEDTWARPDHLQCWTERGQDFARFTRDYRALNTTFNPTDFDPHAWADAAAYAGMKYATFTTKHHDGFCMWDTSTTDYRTTHDSCPIHADPRANIVRHVFDAFRARGMAISCYFSKSDWHCPHYWSPDAPAPTRNPNYDTHARPELWEQFVQYTHQQIEELMTGYGPIDTLWLDGGQVRPPDQDIRMHEIAAMARRHQPGLIMADRTVGGDYEDFITPEQQIPEVPLAVPWESCLTMGNSWKYVPQDQFKSAPELLRMLVETVAKGGNLLLGVGPTPQGTLPSEALERMRQLGGWMAINGEAIYGTRAVAPYHDGELFYTRRDDWVFAICFGEEPPTQIELRKLQPWPDSPVFLLGRDRQLRWSQEGDCARVTLDGDARARAQGRGPWVIKFSGPIDPH
jgi:alpha-L-fucosidase